MWLMLDISCFFTIISIYRLGFFSPCRKQWRNMYPSVTTLLPFSCPFTLCTDIGTSCTRELYPLLTGNKRTFPACTWIVWIRSIVNQKSKNKLVLISQNLSSVLLIDKFFCPKKEEKKLKYMILLWFFIYFYFIYDFYLLWLLLPPTYFLKSNSDAT